MWTKFSFLSFFGPWGLPILYVCRIDFGHHTCKRSNPIPGVHEYCIFYRRSLNTRPAGERTRLYCTTWITFRFESIKNFNVKSCQVPLNVEREAHVCEYIEPLRPCANNFVLPEFALKKETELCYCDCKGMWKIKT